MNHAIKNQKTMKLPYLSRPLCAALCGLSLATAANAQERAREERPPEGQRPPRGDFRPDERRREDARPGEGVRREEFRREEGPRGEGRPMDRDRGDFRPGGPGNPPFNPQELFRDLNEDQRASLRGFFEAQQKVMREMSERSMRLRREIAEQAMAEKLNEGLIREKTMEAAKLEAEATIARARAFAQVRERLPRETVERLRQMVANAGTRPGFAPPGVRRDEDNRREGISAVPRARGKVTSFAGQPVKKVGGRQKATSAARPDRATATRSASPARATVVRVPTGTAAGCGPKESAAATLKGAIAGLNRLAVRQPTSNQTRRLPSQSQATADRGGFAFLLLPS